MSEIVNTYELKNPLVLVPVEREKFYRDQVEVFKTQGEPTFAVEVVNILIFNSHGELIIQKRSFDKKHNSGLLDKSIGGHIQNGDNSYYTVMVETIQELQTPSIVLKDEFNFEKTYRLLSKYLETVALIQYLDTRIVNLKKVIEGEKIKIANKAHLYLGLYDGRIRPVDREAKGVLFYSLKELRKEMNDNPEIFTDDLHFIMREYKEKLEEFVTYITKIK